MTDFIKIYHDKYDGMVGFLDDKKRIILDDWVINVKTNRACLGSDTIGKPLFFLLGSSPAYSNISLAISL